MVRPQLGTSRNFLHPSLVLETPSFTPAYQHHQKGQGLGGFPYDPNYREGTEFSLEAYTPLELPSSPRHAECAEKNKIPASMERHSLLEKENRAKANPALPTC